MSTEIEINPNELIQQQQESNEKGDNNPIIKEVTLDSPIKQIETLLEEEDKPKSIRVQFQLGDVILIESPKNEIVHNQIFLIYYIDKTKIKLINVESNDTTQLNVNMNGIIGDGSIQLIKILSSNKKKGYALQNDLTPGTWINIYFIGDIAYSLTGHITDLENDMIELKLMDDDIIYIDFNYQGLPEDLNIREIEIIPAPSVIQETETETEKEKVTEGIQQPVDVDINKLDTDEDDLKIEPQLAPPIQITDLIEFELGDVMTFQENIGVRREHYRYNIETQTNDMLEQMLSALPVSNQSDKSLNNIHTIINRYIQLRNQVSKFDETYNVKGFIKVDAEDKPLADHLSAFKNKLYWVSLVAKNVKKIYTQNNNEFMADIDTVLLDDTKNLLEINNAFKDFKKSSVNMEEHNKYTELYKNISQLLTPFNQVNPSSENYNNVIVENTVNNDMNVIIDNFEGEPFTSDAISSEELSKRKYITGRYNTGLEILDASNLKGSKIITNRVKMTSDDSIAISSIMTLPEPVVRFSKINLPGSNILTRANLNMHFFNYWQLLKSRTNATNIDITSLNSNIKYTDKNFVDNIKSYHLRLSEPNTGDINPLKLYDQFLKIVFPKTKVLFELVKKYIKGKLSIIDVTDYLEPFMIYTDNLTFTQYKEINYFIREKISEYLKKNVEVSKLFMSIRTGQYRNSFNDETINNILNTISDTNSKNNAPVGENVTEQLTSIYEAYGLDKSLITDKKKSDVNLTSSESLKMIYNLDYGNLFFNQASAKNIHLMYPTELNPIFESDVDDIKRKLDMDTANNKCNSYIIAKKYYDKNALENDNSTTIYFDREYDTTNYDIINENDKYRNAFYQMDPEDFLQYLINELKQKYKKNEDDATYLAETLIHRQKKVLNGNYAVLSVFTSDTPEMLVYYIRQDDQWVPTENIDPKLFLKGDDILCNLQTECLYDPNAKVDNKCTSFDMNKDAIANNALKQIVDQFDKNYEVSKKKLEDRLSHNYERYLNISNSIKDIKQFNEYKTNYEQYLFGNNNELPQIQSPYNKLRDMILGQNDFVKKQYDIIQFCKKYAYKGDLNVPNAIDNNMENPWWLYCLETNAKLMPYFRLVLAQQFIEEPELYNQRLMELKKKIGKKDENDNCWRDIHSGEVICDVDFEVDDYVYSDNAGDDLDENREKLYINTELQTKILDPESQIISNIITSLSDNMGINIDNSYDFIIKTVTEIINDESKFPKEDTYNKIRTKMMSSGKKMVDYSHAYNDRVITVTLGAFLIAVQTSIPPVKTRKTFPGCVRSFKGFPLEGEGNEDGLNYLACVAYHMNHKVSPWTSLAKKKEDKIADIIKYTINKHVIIHEELGIRLKNKAEYLLNHPEKYIPEEHSLSTWSTFLPPLTKFHISNLENVSDDFLSDLRESMKSGSVRQSDDLLVVLSKIIQFSLGIQEEIQKIVDKKDILLKESNKPFVINACCNERDSGNGEMLSTLQYFISESNVIQRHNIVVAHLSEFILNVQLIMRGTSMLSKVNTRRKLVEVSSKYSEETIYQVFIQLCHFQSNIPLSEELMTVCKEKPNYIRKTDKLQDKIAKLKENMHEYTIPQFLKLLQIVAYNNIIRKPISLSDVNYNKNLLLLLERIESENDTHIASSLREHILSVVELNNEHNLTDISNEPEMVSNLKDYLIISNKKMRENLQTFLKKYLSPKSARIYKSCEAFIRDMMIWTEQKNTDSISDDGMYKSIQYFKNLIHMMCKITPEIIINKQVMTIKPVKYWKLSESHNNELIDLVEDYYTPLNKFYSNTMLHKVLKQIKLNTTNIVSLANETPVTTSVKIQDKELVDNVFSKRVAVLLFEYYTLQIFNEYIELTDDKKMYQKINVKGNVNSMLNNEDENVEDLDEREEGEEEDEDEEQYEVTKGKQKDLKVHVAELLGTYIDFAIKSKKVINVSYKELSDIEFIYKDAEKTTFTDKLKKYSIEQRKVNNLFKMHRLEEWGKGERGFGYDKDDYEEKKSTAHNVENLAKRLNKGLEDIDDIDIDEDEYERRVDEDEDDEERNIYNVRGDNDDDDFDENGNEIDTDLNDYATEGFDDDLNYRQTY